MQLVQLLLSAAADPNAAAADGSTPLHVAAAVDNADAVRMLLAAGASDPLHVYIQRFPYRAAGARADTPDSDGVWTPKLI